MLRAQLCSLPGRDGPVLTAGSSRSHLIVDAFLRFLLKIQPTLLLVSTVNEDQPKNFNRYGD